jgi:hypothetical protein
MPAWRITPGKNSKNSGQSENIDGNLEALIERLKIVIPELLIENGLLPASVENVPIRREG